MNINIPDILYNDVKYQQGYLQVAIVGPRAFVQGYGKRFGPHKRFDYQMLWEFEVAQPLSPQRNTKPPTLNEINALGVGITFKHGAD